MEPHLKVARAHRVLAILYALAAILLSLSFLGELTYYAKVGLIAYLVVLTCFFALHIFISLSAFRQRPWARTLSQIIGWLLLFGVPIGTIIGFYLIVISSTKWTTAAPSNASSTTPDTGRISQTLS
jgi:hypothetical protein